MQIDQRHQKVIAVMLGIMLLMLAAGLPRLEKNTSLDAFVPHHSPALALRDEARQAFGLHEPLVVAVVGAEPNSLLHPTALAYVEDIAQTLASVPGVDPQGIQTIGNQAWPRLIEDDIRIERLLPDTGIDSAARVQAALADLPRLDGTLISDNRDAALLVAELRRNAVAGDVYVELRDRLAAHPRPDGLTLHIAGQATISGFLSQYIDQDARRLIPAAIGLMVVIMVIALRWPGAAAYGLVVMLGTLIGTLGLMGWLGLSIYVITSSLPVVLVCIAIADSIHLLARTRHFQRCGQAADTAVNTALAELWRPLILTSLTTAAGFLGVAFGSQIPAMQQYGALAAFGAMLAWAITVTCIPPLYRWHTPRPAPNLKSVTAAPARVWRWLAQRRWAALSGAGLLFATGLIGTSQLEFNYERIKNFAPSSPVYRANSEINQRFDGSHYLDVMLRAGSEGDLMAPETLAAVRDLQQWMRRPESGFRDSLSYVDIILDTRSLISDTPRSAAIAEAADAEQWLFLYEISGEPGDLAQQITPDRSMAYIRGYLRDDEFQRVQPMIESLRQMSATLFADQGLTVDVTGPVALTASWVGPLKGNIISGLVLAVVLVGGMSSLFMRSLHSGLLALIPSIVAVVFVYGLMGWLGIWLDIVTSMFAAISVGLGVDFGIHTAHAMRKAQQGGLAGSSAVEQALSEVGFPLLANACSLALGMSVAALSVIPPVFSFGLLVATAVLSAWLSTLLIVPAMASQGRVASASVDRAVGSS